MTHEITVKQGSVRIYIASESSIAHACRRARKFAETLGSSNLAAYSVAAAASELSSNVLRHGGAGIFLARPCERRVGIELEAIGNGPGIADIFLALTDRFSTADSLGCGLPVVQRQMDELAVTSQAGAGKQVQARKWL